MCKRSLLGVEVNFFSYWDVTGVGNEKEGHVYRGISYSTTEIQRSIYVVSEPFVEKTIKPFFPLLQQTKWEMENIHFTR